MSNNLEYKHIKVWLSDILDELDELGSNAAQSLLRVEADATEANLKQLVGKIQGIHHARQKVENVFGAHQE